MLEISKIKTFEKFSSQEFETLFNRVMERTGKMMYSSKPDGLKLAKQSEHRFVQAVDKEGRVGFYDSFTEGDVITSDHVMLVINTYINWEFDQWDSSASVIQIQVVRFEEDMTTVKEVLHQRYWRCATRTVAANCDDVLVMLNTCISRKEYEIKGSENAKA